MDNKDELYKDAITNNNVEVFKFFSQADFEYRFKSDNNDTLLLYSISDPESNIFTFFVQKGADLYKTNDENETIFHAIVYSGKVERLEYILNHDPTVIKLIDVKNRDGITPVLLSVLLNKMELFFKLLDLGADINISDEEGNTPIHPASFLGLKSIVHALLERGANIHVKTKKGNYPLALAVNGDHEEIAKLLFNKMYNKG